MLLGSLLKFFVIHFCNVSAQSVLKKHVENLKLRESFTVDDEKLFSSIIYTKPCSYPLVTERFLEMIISSKSADF